MDKRKKVLQLVFSVLFLSALIIPSLVWIVMKNSCPPEKFKEKYEYDIGENRNLAELPDKLSNDFGKKFDDYFNDHLPFRSAIISTGQKIENSMNKIYKGKVESFITDIFVGDDVTEYLAPKLVNGLVIPGKNKWLFFIEGLDYYLGNNVLSEDEMSEYAAKVNEVKRLCDEKNKKLYIIFPPNKEEVYSQYMPDYKDVSDVKRNGVLADYLNENTDVDVIYPLDTMKKASEEYQVFYKNDTHWNRYGAKVGVIELYKKIGIDYSALESADCNQVTAEKMDLINIAGFDIRDYEGDADYIFNYKNDKLITSCISEDEEIKDKIYKAEADSDNDIRFLMIGDSFRENMIPFIDKDFSHCSVIHRNALKTQEAKNLILESDIIVIEIVGRYDFDLLDDCDKLIEYLK